MHLSKLPSGNWIAAVKVNGQRSAATGKTKAEAIMAGSELQLQLGGKPKVRNLTVLELLGAWLAQAELSITYRADVLRVIDKLPDEFAGRRIVTVTPVVIEALYRQLKLAGWSPHRIARVHAACSSAWSTARRYEWATDNPFTAAKKPVAPRRKLTPPTPAQIDLLLDAADTRFVVYVALSAALGARRGEMVGLQWPDITDVSVAITRSLAYAPGKGVQITDGKIGEKGWRVVALDAELAASLKALRIEMVALALAAGLPSPVWVFSHDAGVTPWRPDFASREFRRLRKKCKITGVRLHDLRHYVATQLLAAGVPLKTVGDRLGHRQLSTTSDRYGAYVPAADQAAAEIMAALRGKKSAG